MVLEGNFDTIRVVEAQKTAVKKVKISGSDWQLWGISIFGGKKAEVLKKVDGWLKAGDRGKWIATVNAEFVMNACKDRVFFDLLQKTDMNVADAISLVWLRESGILTSGNVIKKLWRGWKTGIGVMKGELSDKVVAGSSLMEDLCKLASERGYSVYFLGGWGQRAQKSSRYFEKRYDGLKSAGFYSGKAYGEDEKTIETIGKRRIDILFVAYGMRRQEEWIERNLSKLNVGVAMGVGRSFDYYSGELRRAPAAWRKAGFEWFYSLIQEPKRWRRQLVLPIFLWKVIFGN